MFAVAACACTAAHVRHLSHVLNLPLPLSSGPFGDPTTDTHMFLLLWNSQTPTAPCFPSVVSHIPNERVQATSLHLSVLHGCRGWGELLPFHLNDGLNKGKYLN